MSPEVIEATGVIVGVIITILQLINGLLMYQVQLKISELKVQLYKEFVTKNELSQVEDSFIRQLELKRT